MSCFNKKKFSVLTQAIKTVSKMVGLWQKDQKWRPYRYILSQTWAYIMTINQHNSVSHAFSVPNWSEMCESSTYWQFFYYRPPGKFRFTHLGEIAKMLFQELVTHIYIYDALDNRYGFSLISSTWDWLHHFSQVLFMKCLEIFFFFF